MDILAGCLKQKTPARREPYPGTSKAENQEDEGRMEKIMLNINDTIETCQNLQLVASGIVGALTQKPELIKSPAYAELVEHVYMAARQAAVVSAMTGDEKTAQFTNDTCNQLAHLADL